VQEKDKYILVLGSKPNSNIPKVEVSHVYSANGAAHRASLYKDFYPETCLVSIVGGREFEKNIEVQKRVIEASPNILISRIFNINIQNYNFDKNMQYKFFSNKQQLQIQSNFFKYNFLDVILKETYYEKKIFAKINHMFKAIKNGSLIGASTGFFTILYALMKHTDKKVIISGIGMMGGGHYYNEKSDRYSNRSLVDRKLILNMKKFFLQKLYTTDQNLADVAGIKIWKSEIIKDFI
jgi:hypothetical protein